MLLAGRSSCCGEGSRTGTKKNPKPKQQTQKRGAQGLKRRINLWSLGRKGNAGRQGNENTMMMSHLWSGYSGQMGELLEPLPRHHSAGAYLGTRCGASKPLLQQYLCYLCPLTAFSEQKAFEDGQSLGLWQSCFYRRDPMAFAALSHSHIWRAGLYFNCHTQFVMLL